MDTAQWFAEIKPYFIIWVTIIAILVAIVDLILYIYRDGKDDTK